MKRMLAILVLGLVLSACERSKPDVKVEKSWARQSLKGVSNGVIFMEIINQGHGDDVLVKAESPVSRVVELHTHIHENGIMRMRPVQDITVKAQDKVVLKPGGLHVMLIGLKKPLQAGESVPLTLHFKESGMQTIDVPVMTQAIH